MGLSEPLVFVDVETTGLNPHEGHKLLEIAVYVASEFSPFTIKGDGFKMVVKQDLADVYGLANGYVREMHNATGLWDKVEDGVPLERIDDALLAFLQERMPRGVGRAAGNSVRLDLNFIDKYLPKSAAYLNYRFLDVTGLSWWAHNMFDVPYYEKQNTHNADEDIKECIAELRHVSERVENLVWGINL